MSYYFDRHTACGKQTKALTPKLSKAFVVFGEILPSLLLAICVYKLTYLAFGVCFKKKMHVVFVMIPLLQGYILERYTQIFLLLCLIYGHQILSCGILQQVKDDSAIEIPNGRYCLISLCISSFLFID